MAQDTRPAEAGVPGPLAGLRVVEACTFVAGPLAGMSLAQQGAEVIRIDQIGGSADGRRWPLAPDGTSLYWVGLNKNKKSVTVDLSSPEGQELVIGLITASGDDAGLFLTNAVGRTWLRYEALRRRRHDLIAVHIQGHPDGSPAVDYTVNARVGLPLVTGPQGWDQPVNHVLPAWDVATGTLAATGLLAAERHRNRTGEGQLVEIALSDVALAVVGNLGYLAEAQLSQHDRDRYGNFVYGTFGADFSTADGRKVMVTAITTRQWRALVEVTGTGPVLKVLEAELGIDLDDEGDRFRVRAAIAAVLGTWFEARTLAEIEDALAGTGVLCGRYQTFRELVADDPECSDDNPLFARIDQPGVGSHLAPGLPLRFSAAGRVDAERAPRLGEHTDEVLATVLQLSDRELGRLHDRSVIAGSATTPG